MEPENTLPDEIPLMVMISTEKKTLGIVSIFDNVAAIKAIKVSKELLHTMPVDWKSGCGFYILVSDKQDGRFSAYVGKATQNNFYARLSSHRRDKENWNYAFLFQRDTSNGLNSTQASYVEGEIYRVLQQVEEINVINSQTAGDKTLADHEVFYMNQVVKSSLRIMDIFGYKIGEKIKPREAPGFTYYGVSIKQLIKSGMLSVGERLHFTIPQYPTTATVGEKGIIFNGEELSPAASAGKASIHTGRGEKSTNGWIHWSVERNDVMIPLADIRDEYLSQKKLHEESLLTEKIDFDEAMSSNENTKLAARKDPNRHVGAQTKVFNLVDAGFLEDGMKIFSLDADNPAEAVIEFDSIKFDMKHYPSVDLAAKYALRVKNPDALAPNGWEFWGLKTKMVKSFHLVKFSTGSLKKRNHYFCLKVG